MHAHRRLAFALFMAALLLHPASRADIYKWVDANGKTHYSDKKEGAGSAAVGAIRPDAAPAPRPAAGTPSWQERELDYQRRQQAAARALPVQAARPKRLSQSYGSNQLDTDKAKCELARDVISGAVRHTNGAVTDTNDRQIATQDIKTFCR
jgi:hypothetical protein